MMDFLKGKASDRKLRFASGQFCHGYVAKFSAECRWGELEWEILLCATEASELGCRPEQMTVEPQEDTLPSILLHPDAYTAAQGTRSALVGKIFRALLTRNDEQNNSWPDWPDALWERIEAESAAVAVAQCAILRELFGNPFRPVVIESAWRTSTVVSLAREMYEAHEFSAMPILADALQDAGCDNEDVLHHCRDAATHIRGCWVVDLILDFGEGGPRPPRPATVLCGYVSVISSYHDV
jgi:hypothetical protein